ncbi:glycine betaine ABC transporter substrate-binding protein [Ligilactobacillus apodemi]|uniref:Glycine betaine L-proline ABC transporter, glycine betaine L-proline-binding protein n=1 Tax=Ligilactobacillus apodemi DSM 16634 = JCM 16172 TaxID=1423724 RepID=A0A0R1U110_9LACO|nr:glycine betaine ABC transporter substrate-binding protein [Ligilactobacillus apodemi]KRL84883.1 glycine betaine L-proline ABC transporter, glycine betaine L-proline-binding protein [Ligilactobacillus apodemi DSM 16634 = JCM 16172]MBD5069058.1 glycine/betaine ABC transporter [Lactobacillus sp.]MCR1901016.1 glycine/betaine ABC transporter [Ligilactobacillus apodemi]
MKKLKKIFFPLLALLVFTLSGCSNQATAKYDASKPLGPQINYTITGIDAGAGIMGNTQTALEKYGLAQKNWQLQTSSTAAMTSVLDKAIKNKQPIVVTGWIPHWMFTKYKLKFLQDPKKVYGDAEGIHTIARLNLKKEEPGFYQFLENFNWTSDQMSEVMLQINEGADATQAAKDYLKKHPKQLKEWLKNVPNGNGKKVTLAYVAWDSEIASANVAKQALESKGYKVTIRSMDAQPMWTAVATGAVDASLSAWLPTTHSAYAKSFKGKYIDVRTNMEGAKTGLAVPTYMTNINSISDLLNK